MAVPMRKSDQVNEADIAKEQAEASGRTSVREISGDLPLSIDDREYLSPARRMQETLGREFAYADEAPWSQRRTLAFITLTCGAFWTCVYFMIAALVG